MVGDEKEKLIKSQPNENEKAAGMASRSCTDVFCLALFFGFIAGMVWIQMYAQENGDIRRLSHGFNFKGALCGVSPGYDEKPYLYFCPTGLPIPGTSPPLPSALDLIHPICVSECPQGPAQSFLCYGGAQVETMSPTNAEGDYKEVITYDFMRTDGYASKPFMNRYCLPAQEKLAAELLENVSKGKVSQAMMKVGTVRAAYPALIAAAALAFACGYGYLFMLRVFARILVYGCILAIMCMSSGGGGFLIYMSQVGGVSKASGDATTDLVIGCVLIGIAVVFMIIVVCKRKSIEISISVVEAACQCMFAMPSLLIQPAIEIVVKMVVLAFLLYGFMWVMSTGDVKSSKATIGGVKVSGLSRTFEWTEEEYYMMAYWIFGLFWVMELFTALGQFVISYSVTLWYFTPKDGAGYKTAPKAALVRGFLVGVFFHLGTLAFGAFLIAVCRMINLIMGMLAKQAKAQGNRAMELVAKGLMCLVTCFQKFLEFINKNAYMDVAIRSTNFISAAKHAFEMITANIATIALLNGACFIFQLVGAVLISFGGAFLTYLLVTNHPVFTSNDSPYYIVDPVFIAGVSFLICLVIAISFMIIFDQTADTLLYCFIYDKEQGAHPGIEFAPTGLQRLIDEAYAKK